MYYNQYNFVCGCLRAENRLIDIILLCSLYTLHFERYCVKKISDWTASKEFPFNIIFLFSYESLENVSQKVSSPIFARCIDDAGHYYCRRLQSVIIIILSLIMASFFFFISYDIKCYLPFVRGPFISSARFMFFISLKCFFEDINVNTVV